MTDELKQEMTEKFNSAYGEEVKIGLREALRKVYIHGCEHGYQYAVDKACEFIRLHIGVDMPVRLSPDGEPLAEDFINKAEARVNAANKVVEQFKRFMEE